MTRNEAFGKKVRTLREEKRRGDPEFSLRQFALKVGLSATFVSKVENGKLDPPAPGKIILMAELLGTDPDELLAIAGKMDPEIKGFVMSEQRAVACFLREAKRRREQGESFEDMTRRLSSCD